MAHVLEWLKQIDGVVPPNIVAAVALAVSIYAVWAGERRHKKSEADRLRDRLGLYAHASGGDAIILTLNFRPPSRHTRYRAKLKMVSPADAQLSILGWAANDGVISPLRRHYDRTAVRYRDLDVELDDSPTAAGEMQARVAISAERTLGTARVHIEIIDAATDKRILSLEEAIKP